MRAQPDPPGSAQERVTLCDAPYTPPGTLATVAGSWQSAMVVKLNAAGWVSAFPATSVAPAPTARWYVVLQARRSFGVMVSVLPAGVKVKATPWSKDTAPSNAAALISSLKLAVTTLSTATPVAPFAGSLPASAGGTLSMT